MTLDSATLLYPDNSTDLPEGYAEVERKRIEWPDYISFTYYNPDKENDQGISFDY